jgi:hypothetical protein
MKSHWMNRIGIGAMLVVVAMPALALAQGKSKAKGAEKKSEKTVVVTSKGEVVSDKKLDKAVRKRVTPSQAVIVTRDVLVANGYRVINVAPSGTTQVIYYRRGNMGNGRGLGPIEKIYVVPNGEIVTLRSVPDPLLSTILRRLGI